MSATSFKTISMNKSPKVHVVTRKRFSCKWLVTVLAPSESKKCRMEEIWLSFSFAQNKNSHYMEVSHRVHLK
jgi:hypothetical protein